MLTRRGEEKKRFEKEQATPPLKKRGSAQSSARGKREREKKRE